MNDPYKQPAPCAPIVAGILALTMIPPLLFSWWIKPVETTQAFMKFWADHAEYR